MNIPQAIFFKPLVHLLGKQVRFENIPFVNRIPVPEALKKAINDGLKKAIGGLVK
jgi:hypothetical protein